jgi:sugar phosphate isomerase/epimerase
MDKITRRTFLAQSAAAGVAFAALPIAGWADALNSPFKVAVINDEISADFDHSCYVAAHDFGMSWIELRSMWKTNVSSLSDAQISESKKILAKYNLRVTDIASPLFKAYWPGAPVSVSTESAGKDMHLAPEATFKQQDEIMERCIALAKQFGTNKIRCFDFWRIHDVAPYRADIDEKLRVTAEKVGRQDLLLVLENEPDCNTATAPEAARLLKAIQTPHLSLNWDCANAVLTGELDAFPAGWNMLPKNRIHHCHIKNVIKDASGKLGWSPIGKGYVDWASQFRALKAAGYRDAVSLETHWRGGGTPEESTRICWDGMKQALKDASAL